MPMSSLTLRPKTILRIVVNLGMQLTVSHGNTLQLKFLCCTKSCRNSSSLTINRAKRSSTRHNTVGAVPHGGAQNGAVSPFSKSSCMPVARA